jgi:hypothetical protein
LLRSGTLGSKRQPPVSIPLPFDKAVDGLRAVDPKEPIGADKGAKAAKKKLRPKK